MGATVSTGKEVAAFTRADGKVIYVLFERTYEKNCYPHNPTWSAVALGLYEDVMRFVFRGAACCEGGMLQTSSGHTTPENYLDRWKQAFAKPHAMPEKQITIEIAESFRAPITTERASEAKAALAKAGRGDVAAGLEAGRVTLSLHNDIDALVALYGVGAYLGPWRVIQHGDMSTSIDKSLAPKPVKAIVVAPTMRLLKIDRYEMLVAAGDTPWKASGWAYSVVGDYVNHVAYPLEMQCTGSARSLITAFRQQVEEAPDMPAGTVITVRPDTLEREDWHRRNAEAIAEVFGHAGEGRKCPPSFSFTAAQAVEKDHLYQVAHLHPSQLTWSVPESAMPASSTDVAMPMTSGTAMEQPSLF